MATRKQIDDFNKAERAKLEKTHKLADADWRIWVPRAEADDPTPLAGNEPFACPVVQETEAEARQRRHEEREGRAQRLTFHQRFGRWPTDAEIAALRANAEAHRRFNAL